MHVTIVLLVWTSLPRMNCTIDDFCKFHDPWPFKIDLSGGDAVNCFALGMYNNSAGPFHRGNSRMLSLILICLRLRLLQYKLRSIDSIWSNFFVVKIHISL